MALALRLTALGTQVAFTATLALLAGDIASQQVPNEPALLFGLAGGTTAMIAWNLLGRFFRRVNGEAR
jgi:hypothetical protein